MRAGGFQWELHAQELLDRGVEFRQFVMPSDDEEEEEEEGGRTPLSARHSLAYSDAPSLTRAHSQAHPDTPPHADGKPPHADGHAVTLPGQQQPPSPMRRSLSRRPSKRKSLERR